MIFHSFYDIIKVKIPSNRKKKKFFYKSVGFTKDFCDHQKLLRINDRKPD